MNYRHHLCADVPIVVSLVSPAWGVNSEQFHLVVDELLQRNSGETRVGEHDVSRWLVQIMLVLRNVIRGELDAESMDHHALRHTKPLSDFRKLFS